MTAAGHPFERRAHARLQFRFEVEVQCGDASVTGQLRDLSLGGARVSLERGLVHRGTPVRLGLTRPDGGKDLYECIVVRLEPAEDGDTVGLRFQVFDEAQREQLRAMLIGLMRGQEQTSRRVFPRLACRMEARYSTPVELRAMVEDISRGGLSVTTDEPAELGQEVLFVLPDSAGDDMLTLRATVVHARASASGSQTSRVGLRFTPMTEERNHLLRALLEFLGSR